MFRIAICDDMEDTLIYTKALLDHWKERPKQYFVKTFDNGDDLIAAHKTSPFDIILLDVVMPLLNGIETAQEIRQFDKTVKIVFLTSAPEYALESYSVKASNYLLKPIAPQLLYACVEELLEELHITQGSILVRCSSTVHRVALEDISYVEAQNKTVLFHLTNGRTLSSALTLYNLEETLSLKDGFFRCHRSYIVNLNCVDTFTHTEARMRHGTIVPISRKYQKEFETCYFDVIFGKAGEH